MTENSSRKCAMITGASRGIGRASAEIFARHGYDLILTCRSSMESLRGLADRLQALYGILCMPVQADMGLEEDVTRLFSLTNRLDVLDRKSVV